MEEIKPYLKVRQRELLFREGVMFFLGVGQDEKRQRQDDDEYQAAVRMAKANAQQSEPQA